MNHNEELLIEEVKDITPKLEKELYSVIVQLNPATRMENFHEWLVRVINFPQEHLYIAKEISGKVLGTLTLVSYPLLEGEEKTWIENVVVDIEARGKGVGEKLVKCALERARKLGKDHINLTSNPTRTAANNLYQKLGFKEYNTNYYRLYLKK
jgi:ribosomal protein S18 acetylase RimI-like enzyme